MFSCQIKEQGWQLIRKDVIRDTFKSIKYILTDCDGVIWQGNRALPGATDLLGLFRNQNKRVIYVTNNSTKTRNQYLDKCKQLGFSATLDEIYTTSYCTAAFLKSVNFSGKIYLIGSKAVHEELVLAGFNCDLPEDFQVVPDEYAEWMKTHLPMDDGIKAVVVGFDVHFGIAKLTKAATYLNSKDCLFVATNTDEQFPTGDNLRVVPGTGAIVRCVEVAAGRKADVIIGKPHETMVRMVQQTFPDLNSSNSIMMGDRLNTDIAFGVGNAIPTLLVETGVHKRKDIEDSDAVPTYVSPDLCQLYEMLR